MQKAYADIMTIIENTDLPAWFITFTGNPNWPEILRNIAKGENRADVKCRVFMAKAQQFLDDLFKRNLFGKVQAYHVVMEFQKRGMPHLHVILIMDKQVGANEVDKYISARIPDLPDPKDRSEAAIQLRRLHEIIMRNNIHLCNENSGCQINGICTKGYKKPFSQSTVIHSHKPAEYQRLPPKTKNDGKKQSEKEKKKPALKTEYSDEEEFEKDIILNEDDDKAEEYFDYLDEVRKDFDLDQVEYKRLPPAPDSTEITDENEHLFGNTYLKEIKKGVYVEIDDGHIVPYNPFLSLRYDCHINVECTVGQTASPKYTCKYTTKLGEVICAKGYKLKDKEKESDPDVIDFNEAEQHILARIMTACEAWMRLNNTWIIKQSHIVETLYVHLENEESVYFKEGDEEKAVEKQDKSTLLAFFRLCESDAVARNYTYGEIPLHYRYLKKEGVWVKRIRNPQKFFVRVHHVPPREVELYALRVLLMNVKGPTSFKNLKTVEEEECKTFVAAAQKLGLWDSEEIHFQVIEEAIREMRSAKQQKHFLAMVIAHNRPSNADKFIDHFLNTIFLPYGMLPTDQIEQRKHKALCYLEYIFQKMDTSCRRLGLTVPDSFENNYDSSEAEREFDDFEDLMVEGKKVSPQVYAEAQRTKLEKSEDQINAFNYIWDTVVNQTGEFMMLQGEGGAGKTFVYNTLIDYCIAHGKKVLACASTGIAATLLKGGMTAHSAFCIPKELDHETPPRIGGETKKGQLLASADLIIIDEVSMLHKDVLKFIDRTLRDLKDKTKLFGGAAVLIGGDWKQLTPVVPKAQAPKIIESSVKNWKEFQNVKHLNLTKNMRVNPNELHFVELLKTIGNGDKSIFIPGSDCTISVDPENAVKNVTELINFCFEQEWLQNPEENIENLCGSAILCPTNTVVQKVNIDLLSCLVGEQKIYLSRDTPFTDNVVNPIDDNVDDYSIEAMHKIETAGMPPHELKIKKGAIVMLIKNLSVFTGLCNGTRMQIIDFTDEFLKCKILSGPRSKANELIYLPRCKFEYGGCLSEPGVRFTRTQFPVKLSFAISINKAQGQTLNRVGLLFCHGKECFSHGQLYTAMSRVRTKASLKILPALPLKLTTKNIVFHQLLI
uniref:ATP-dependent DNA helicase n=1 Tax=Panagrolaimus sp. ES5 TaxID=591445 RepID=A0AC34FIM2_9BILA